jgi:hypothetical protein
MVTDQKNTNDKATQPGTPAPTHTNPDVDESVDEDDAWEGFTLDASIFRSGGDYEEE